MDLVIRNGHIVTAAGQRDADVGVADGKIAVLTPHLDLDCPTIDASGCYVFPGFIDPHTHMELPVAGTVSSDDFYTGTRAAAAGGITTIIDFCSQAPGQTFEQVIGLWHRRAGKSVIDYGFHLIVPQLSLSQVEHLHEVVEEGITTVKCMMAYKRGPQGSNDANLLRVMMRAREIGALPMVHAENGEAVDVLTDRLLSNGSTGPQYHPVSRPTAVEAEAVNRAGMLSELAEYCVYIVHLSSAAALEEVRRARDLGRSVYAETCPQYLTLDETVYTAPGFEAAKYVCSPPLRSVDNHAALWSGIQGGPLDLVASDHCPFFHHGQKSLGSESFAAIPNGMPTIETMFPLLFSEGVVGGRISRERFVQLSSTHAARMFGIYPEKGEIAEGSDADLVVFDPDARVTVGARTLHSRVDYSPYEGREVIGRPIYTISRGEVLYELGGFTPAARRARGRFLRRRPWTGYPLA